jgi:hypothetical protein
MFFLGEKKVFLSSIFFGDENKEENQCDGYLMMI